MLRYIGQVPVSFMSLPWLGEIQPGAEFPVSDEVGATLLDRSDIASVLVEQPAVDAEPEATTPAKARKGSAAKPSAVEQPAGDAPPAGE